MNVVVGAIPGRKGSSNFMSTMAVSYDGKMPPRLATFKNSHPPTPRAANPAIAFSFSVYVLILQCCSKVLLLGRTDLDNFFPHKQNQWSPVEAL